MHGLQLNQVCFSGTPYYESVPDCYKDFGFKTVSTNPCGEIPLCPYDSCRLIAINLYSYVKNPFTADATFDRELFKKHVRTTTRIMDDIVDLEMEKVESILKKIESDPESEETKHVEKQVGQSGVTVASKLYVACGISGAVQHVVGMEHSDVIIGINKDANAPIFNVCKYALVGDAKQVLAKVLEQLKK